eukprot:scaffold1054_cov333-Pavlova_lutheri.AAC.7
MPPSVRGCPSNCPKTWSPLPCTASIIKGREGPSGGAFTCKLRFRYNGLKRSRIHGFHKGSSRSMIHRGEVGNTTYEFAK